MVIITWIDKYRITYIMRSTYKQMVQALKSAYRWILRHHTDADSMDSVFSDCIGNDCIRHRQQQSLLFSVLYNYIVQDALMAVIQISEFIFVPRTRLICVRRHVLFAVLRWDALRQSEMDHYLINGLKNALIESPHYAESKITAVSESNAAQQNSEL